MPDPFDDLKAAIRAAQEDWVRNNAPAYVTDDDMMTIGQNSPAAKEILSRVRQMFPDLDALQVTYANHVGRDFSKSGNESIKNIGTRTVHAYMRRELSPGVKQATLFAIVPGDHWRFKGGLYQLDGAPGRTALHLLDMREMANTFLRWAKRKSDRAAKDEKAGTVLLDVLDQHNLDGTLEDVGPAAYAQFTAVLGEDDGEPGGEDE